MMENRCGFCDKKSLSLRRCSGCQQVQYCSTVCQREDWKGQHKVKCKELQKSRGEGDKSAEAKGVPSKQCPDDGNNDNRTGRTVYPAESTIGYHRDRMQSFVNHPDYVSFWDNFSASGVGVPNANDQRTSCGSVDGSSERRTCVVCGKTDVTVKTCSRCKTVNYCSKKCQKQNRKVHKSQCKIPDEDVEESITTKRYGQDIIRVDMDQFCRCRSDADIAYRAYSRPAGIEQAKRLTYKAFPGCTILDFVPEIPHEMFGMRPRGSSKVAVGFISRFHDYVMRHCIYFQDKNGDEVYVGFYLDNDDPSPYFRWDDVVPGRYICIEDPYIHPFGDGSIGIRVDFSSCVRIFSIA